MLLLTGVFYLLTGCGRLGGNDLESMILKSTGELFLLKEPGTEMSIKTGDTLSPGAGLRTGKNGRALVGIFGGTKVRLEPETEVMLPGKSGGNEPGTIHVMIKITRGVMILFVPSSRSDSTFGVETERVSLSTRDGSFLVKVRENKLQIAVGKGTLQVTDKRSGESAGLKEKQSLTMTRYTIRLRPESYDWETEKELFDLSIPE
ncbi:MAG: FecR domain-containing protein [bacterium]|nr:FecR domain-containing protein [bacterium]